MMTAVSAEKNSYGISRRMTTGGHRPHKQVTLSGRGPHGELTALKSSVHLVSGRSILCLPICGNLFCALVFFRYYKY